jgi:hypothetical protein
MEANIGRDKYKLAPALGDRTLASAPDDTTVLGKVVGTARDLIQGEVHSAREQESRNKFNEEVAAVAVDVVVSLPRLNIVAAGTIKALSLLNLNAGIKQNIYAGIENFAEGSGLNILGRVSGERISGWRQRLQEVRSPEFPTALSSNQVFATAYYPGIDRMRWAVKELPGATTQIKLNSLTSNLERQHFNELPTQPDESAVREETYRKLAFPSISFPSATELEARLILPNGSVTNTTQMRVRPDSQNAVWRDEADFNSHLEPYKVQMTTYGVLGADHKPLPIQIHVPVQYDANVVRPMRALRQLAATPVSIDNDALHLRQFFANFPEQAINAQPPESMPADMKREIVDRLSSLTEEERRQICAIFAARRRLGEGDPATQALLPEDVIPFLQQTKNVKTVVLSDQNWERDAWMRRNNSAKYYDPNFTAAATADHERGLITFFKGTRPEILQPQSVDRLADLFNHEDTHLMREHKPEYDAAYHLESLSAEEMHSVSSYARLNEEEDRAESRTVFLKPDPDEFWEFAKKAPARAAVLAKAESANLAKFVEASPHPNSVGIGNRIAYVDEHAVPLAQNIARRYLKSDDPKIVESSARLLGLIGGLEDIPELERLSQFDARVELTIKRMESAQRGDQPESDFAQLIANNQAMDERNERNLAAAAAREALSKLRASLLKDVFPGYQNGLP